MTAERKHAPTEVEEFYIRSNPEGLTETQISDKLGVVLGAVKKIFKEEAVKRTVANESTREDIPQENFVRKMILPPVESGKKRRGLAIMRGQVSEVLDETNKENRAKARRASDSEYLGKTYPKEGR
jgi:hypothetical protein